MQFRDLTDDLIRDRIVVGVFDKGTRTRLLRERQLTLETAMGIVRSGEMADEQIQKLANCTVGNTNVCAVKKKKHNKTKKPQINDSKDSVFKTQKNCKYCAKKHKQGECPAYGATCNFCKGLHHFESVCFKKRDRNGKAYKARVNTLYDEYEDSSESDNGYTDDTYSGGLFIGCLEVSPIAITYRSNSPEQYQ